MGQSAADIKAELLAEYENILDEVLSQVEGKQGLSLMDIEEVGLQARAAVGQQMTAALLATNSGQSIPEPRRTKCGQEMSYKGEKHRYLRTCRGDVEDEVWKIIAALHEANLSHHAAYLEAHCYRML